MNMTVYKHDVFGKIRTTINDDVVYFSGKDVCVAFGDKNHNRSLRRVDEEDKKEIDIVDSLGRVQKAIFVNESGLYTLLFTMQPKRANNNGVSNAYPTEVQERIDKLHQFKHWVTSEVLPSIRKTGSYITEGSETQQYINQLQETVTELSLKLMEIHKELRVLTTKPVVDMKVVNTWKKYVVTPRVKILSANSGIDIKDCYKMIYDVMLDDYGFCESAVINDFINNYDCDNVSTITIIATDKIYRQWFVQAADKLIECVSPVVPQITSCDFDKALGEFNSANEVQPLKDDIQEDHIQSEHFRKLSVNDEYEEIIDYIAALRGDRSKTKLATKKYIFPLMSSPKGWKIALSRNRCATKKALIKTNIKYKKRFVRICNEIVDNYKYNKLDLNN